MYDILIIGAGIIGTSIARELSKYKLKVAVLEKDTDVANETTKANSETIPAEVQCSATIAFSSTFGSISLNFFWLIMAKPGTLFIIPLL